MTSSSPEEIICPLCNNVFFNYGFIACELMQFICYHTFNQNMVLYHDRKSNKGYKESVKFLERKGYLVTTELDKYDVGISIANPSKCFDYERAVFCWCHTRKL